MKVAIIGMGVVGAAQARMFGTAYRLVTYDITDGPCPRDEIGSCEFAVICAGTPQGPDGAADLSQVRAAVAALPDAMPALIRSTVPPGTTDGLAAGREGLTGFAPEFLYEGGTGPWTQAADVPWLLLGGPQEAREFFRPRLSAAFSGRIHDCPAIVAELAKYTANLYWAMRVTFVNELAAVSGAFGADWEDVRDAWLQDDRVHPAHTAMAGFPPGFAGRCWPKDLAALIAASADAGHKALFLEAVQDANGRFREDADGR